LGFKGCAAPSHGIIKSLPGLIELAGESATGLSCSMERWSGERPACDNIFQW
jgi:hypothetical protein